MTPSKSPSFETTKSGESNQGLESNHGCCYCNKQLSVMKLCTSCKTVYYCSKTCQENHWSQHKSICQSVKILEGNTSKHEISIDELKGNVYELSPKGRTKIAKAVGERCLVNILLDGKDREVLWDTGAQVCLAGKGWMEERFPDKQLRPVSELFEKGLSVKSASGEELNRGQGFFKLRKCVCSIFNHQTGFRNPYFRIQCHF